MPRRMTSTAVRTCARTEASRPCRPRRSDHERGGTAGHSKSTNGSVTTTAWRGPHQLRRRGLLRVADGPDAVATISKRSSAAERAGNVVLAANAAINSAEVLGDQGHWTTSAGALRRRTAQLPGRRLSPGCRCTSPLLCCLGNARRQASASGSRRTEARATLATDRRLELELLPRPAARELELAVLERRRADEAMCIAVARSTATNR